jgi:hypothetical protein
MGYSVLPLRAKEHPLFAPSSFPPTRRHAIEGLRHRSFTLHLLLGLSRRPTSGKRDELRRRVNF